MANRKKIGKKKYQRYRDEHRKEKNKIRKLTNYLRKHPNNFIAKERLEELSGKYA